MENGLENPRIDQRLRREINNLYSNEGLTSDLDDTSAKILLGWLEALVKRIVSRTAGMEDEPAEEAMYPRLKALRRLARVVNQAIRRQAEPAVLVEKILEHAQELYGEDFIQPDRQKIHALLGMSIIETEIFILTLQQILEGDLDGKED